MNYSRTNTGRLPRLFDELKLALSQASREDLSAWGKASASRLPAIGRRRLQNLGNLARRVGRFTGEELKSAKEAWQRGALGAHVEQRAATGIDRTLEAGQRAWATLNVLGRTILEDPKANAPGILALSLGFLAGSGGVDGNGGVPDTDIALFGIGGHRSMLTHSIIAGVVVEGSILAVADLAGLVVKKLPPDNRDPFWDVLDRTRDQIAHQLATGASAGIAYHLAVDATLQPAAYKDLPISLPMEAHQFLFALNSIAEGADATSKGETSGQKVTRTVREGMIGAATSIKALLKKA